MIAAAACGVLNVLLTLPCLRVAGDYFVVTSFGIQLLATAVFINWTALTGGAPGLPGIPAPVIFGYEFDSPQPFAAISTAASLLVCVCLSGC